MSDLAQHMAGVAREILGEPNRHLSSEGRELRWGSGGSVSVDVRKGTVFDHELNEGGGVLWLIEQRLGLKGRDAFEWMSEHGYRVDAHADTRPRQPQRPAPRPEPQARAPKPEPGGEWAFLGMSADTKLVRTYDYTNEAGELLYQVCRFEWPNPEKATGYDKTFRQRRPDASKRSGWAWNLEGIKHGLYRLTELHEALAEDATVFLAEGEKDVETLTELGVPATTNSGGAKHWGADHAAAFKDADVVLLIDNDAAGRARIDVVAGSLNGIARRIRVLDLAKHWPAMPDKGDVTDWAKFAGGTADQLYEFAAKTPTWRPNADGFKSKLGLVLWRDMAKPKDPIEYLIKGWLTAGEVSIFAGPSGSGKTFVVLDMAMCIARAVAFLGRYRVNGGGVVYQAGEGAKGLRDKRIPAYMQKHGLSFQDEIPFALLPRPIDLFGGEDHTEALIADVKAAEAEMSTKVKLVVIDTASAATPGADENNAKDVSPVLARCNRIAAECQAAVMLVAHMNSEGKKVRGHTSWTANVDTVMVSKIVEGMHDAGRRPVREIEITKQKDGEQGLKTRFVLPALTIGRDADGDEIRSCTIAEPDEGELTGIDQSTPAEGGSLSPQAFNFVRALDKAVEEHGVEATSVGIALPYGMRVVDFTHFREVFAATSFEGADEADQKTRANTIRKAIKRNGEKLMAAGVIGRKDPYIWRTGKAIKGAPNPDADVPQNGDPVPPNGASGPIWGDLSA